LIEEEAGKRHLAGDSSRAATSTAVKALRRSSQVLNKAVPSNSSTSPAEIRLDGGWGAAA